MIPQGFPSAVAVGQALLLRAFVPGMEWQGHVDVPPKDRHRSRVVQAANKKPFVQTYDTERNRVWAQHAGTTVLAQLRGVEVQGDNDFVMPLTDRRIILNLRFYLRRPASYPKRVVYPTTKPDLDNLVKALTDALVSAHVISDDNCITDEVLSKRYADAEHPIGIELEMTCLPL